MTRPSPVAALLATATTVRGRFPKHGRPGEVMKRVDGQGNVTHYQTYAADGLPSKRVDLAGAPHGGVSTPHVVEYTRHTDPRTGATFVRPEPPRPATSDELP